MRDIKDFNDTIHRIESACTIFQKGIYHLYWLGQKKDADIFAQGLRIYQCLFQLCLTQMLLDFDYEIRMNPRRLGPLKKLCKNSKEPTRAEVDPAAIIQHGDIQKYRDALRKEHRLYDVSKRSLELFNRAINARHNLIYRPFLLDRNGGNFWEDCTLIDLLEDLPSFSEIQTTYKDFIDLMLNWYQTEIVKYQKLTLPLPPPPSIDKNLISSTTSKTSSSKTNTPKPFCSISFLQGLFSLYRDERDDRQTETLLLTYARMLNPNDNGLLEEIRAYRNQLFDLENFIKIVYIPEKWQAGKL